MWSGVAVADEGERVPFSAAAERAALGHDGIFVGMRIGRGAGHRAVGTEMAAILADLRHGGVVAELLEPLGRRHHLQGALDPAFRARG